MRIRSVRAALFTDRVTGRWPAEWVLVYVALWILADDEGRFEWEEDAIKGQLFPYRPDFDLSGILLSIQATGRVIRYEVDGVSYGVIPTFKRYQKPNRPLPSTLPPPPSSEDSVSTHGALTPGEERRGEEGRGDPASPAARHREVIDLWCRLWAGLRGGAYLIQPKDAAGVKRLLGRIQATPVAEVERRMRYAFADPWFAENGSLALFVSRWSNYDRPHAVRAVNGSAAPSSPQRLIVGFDPDTKEPRYAD